MEIDIDPKNPPKGDSDWGAIDALSDEEIERRARSDPDNQPLSDKDFATLRRVPRVRILRMKLGMTQEEFADKFQLSPATLRDWEQGRTEPDQASRTLLKLIAAMPDQVREALART